MLDEDIILTVVKYVSLGDLILKFMRLSKGIRALIQSDNYMVFKKFLKLFSLTKELRRSQLPAFVDIFKLIKDNVCLPMNQGEPNQLSPVVYYTNGGVQDDDP